MNQALLKSLTDASQCADKVEGLTHAFYRYPARFSPSFASAAIRLFTEPGDLVMDPFMGGGTTLVEAAASGRRAVGTDISGLAVFVSQVKTTPLSQADIAELGAWASQLRPRLNTHKPSARPQRWVEEGYQRNLSAPETWRIRKTLEQILEEGACLPRLRLERFARCVALRTAQWALDCRRELPLTAEFRDKFFNLFDEMCTSAGEFTLAVESNGRLGGPSVLCLNRSAADLASEAHVAKTGPPKLILTSPPYPGVHVLYHRWQIQSRKETPAPFWIANCLDGKGEAFYTFGGRKQKSLDNYFDQLDRVCRSLVDLCDRNTTIVQMVSFSEPQWQLPRYLDVMASAGFRELLHSWGDESEGSRLWRTVPHRRWYADRGSDVATKREVVLVHRQR